jgi:hypothetical protein
MFFRESLCPQGKSSFCEQKEAKKLYLSWAMGVIADHAHGPA